jgi:hypothetical protein
MQASTAVGTIALVLAAALAIGRAFGDDVLTPPPSAPKTMQQRIDEREAQRRAAAVAQERRKEEFARRCSKPVKTPSELEGCKNVYREM